MLLQDCLWTSGHQLKLVCHAHVEIVTKGKEGTVKIHSVDRHFAASTAVRLHFYCVDNSLVKSHKGEKRKTFAIISPFVSE